MYADLSAGRELGQIHFVLNPEFFVGRDLFLSAIDNMVEEIHSMKPAHGFDKVNYPGERFEGVRARDREEGIPIVKEIYDYLVGDKVHCNRYDGMNAFAMD
jgi:ureidoglycolate dehydrogenase (NAD+)